MSKRYTYTVQQLARLAGVSVRTLHYYDHIGLLKPSAQAAAGYHLYGEADLLRLQQILLFRELDFLLASPPKISAPINGANKDRRAWLHQATTMMSKFPGR